MLEHYLSLATKATFVENMALAYFLGMCSFLAVSRKVETAIGLGIAVIFVLTVTTPFSSVRSCPMPRWSHRLASGLPSASTTRSSRVSPRSRVTATSGPGGRWLTSTARTSMGRQPGAENRRS